jgi:hypothetical protein
LAVNYVEFEEREVTHNRFLYRVSQIKYVTMLFLTGHLPDSKLPIVTETGILTPLGKPTSWIDFNK